jgi:hypothetical protein
MIQNSSIEYQPFLREIIITHRKKFQKIDLSIMIMDIDVA